MEKIVPARRTENIAYAIRDIVVLANRLKKEGRTILHLNIGDPCKFDFHPPTHIIEAVYQAMKNNHNGYSPSSGIPEAIEALQKEAGKYGIRNIQDIFVSTGGSEAIEICLTALVNEDENVLIPAPGYPLYSAVLSKLQTRLNYYYLNENNDWQPDIEDIEKRINEKTRGIVLINPNNPTGSVCTRKTLLELAELADRHNLLIFADEIYNKLILDDGIEHISIASLNPDIPVVTFNGLSKCYVGPGWRLGWAIISGAKEVTEEYVKAVQKIVRARLCANHPEQYAIAPALEGPQDNLRDMKEKLRERRDITITRLNHMKVVSCVKPTGAFYAFPRLNIEGEDEDFVKRLLYDTGVLTVHGSGFEEYPGSKHFRIVFLPPPDILIPAFDKIEDFINTNY
jgi:alanine-synthesizing transaminase